MPETLAYCPVQFLAHPVVPALLIVLGFLLLWAYSQRAESAPLLINPRTQRPFETDLKTALKKAAKATIFGAVVALIIWACRRCGGSADRGIRGAESCPAGG